MNYNISFKEREKIAKELLSKQLPVSLEQMRAQALWLKTMSNTNKKKQSD